MPLSVIKPLSVLTGGTGGGGGANKPNLSPDGEIPGNRVKKMNGHD